MIIIDLSGGLVNRGLILQTLFGRSLRRSVDLLLRVVRRGIAPTRRVVTRSSCPFVLPVACITGLIHAAIDASTTLIKMLLVTRGSRSVSLTPAVLIANAAILRRGRIVMTGSLPF